MITLYPEMLSIMKLRRVAHKFYNMIICGKEEELFEDTLLFKEN